MISSDQISVVVQGALDPALIFRVLKSVRETLPNSRIILSTWKGSPCLEELRENKLYDDLLLNEDPGAYYFGEWDKKNNLNRMLLSTQQGLSLVRTKYTLKIRSDLGVKHTGFIKYFFDDSLSKRSLDWCTFKKRLITSSLYTIQYEELGNKKHYRPFHVSDWWYFGLTEDIKDLFSVPLAKEPEFTRWFITHAADPEKFHRFPWLTWRFSPEQYLQISYLLHSKKLKIKCNDILDYNAKNINESRQYIVNNYITLEQKDSGIVPMKEKYAKLKIFFDENIRSSVYTFPKWQREYSDLVDKNYEISTSDTIKYYLYSKRTPFIVAAHFRNLYWLCKDFSLFLPRVVKEVYYLTKDVAKVGINLIIKKMGGG